MIKTLLIAALLIFVSGLSKDNETAHTLLLIAGSMLFGFGIKPLHWWLGTQSVQGRWMSRFVYGNTGQWVIGIVFFLTILALLYLGISVIFE